MDPNANLGELLAIARGIYDNELDPQNIDDALELALQSDRLAELVLALDQWLVKGGFLPQRWSKCEAL